MKNTKWKRSFQNFTWFKIPCDQQTSIPLALGKYNLKRVLKIGSIYVNFPQKWLQVKNMCLKSIFCVFDFTVPQKYFIFRSVPQQHSVWKRWMLKVKWNVT
jgi:hypothetical protein